MRDAMIGHTGRFAIFNQERVPYPVAGQGFNIGFKDRQSRVRQGRGGSGKDSDGSILLVGDDRVLGRPTTGFEASAADLPSCLLTVDGLARSPH